MTPGGRRAGGRTSKGQARGVIVLAGEDRNDCQILAELIRAHRPDPGRDRQAGPYQRPGAAAQEVGRGAGRRREDPGREGLREGLRERADLLGFVVHEDLDGYADAGYDRIRKALADELGRQCPQFRTALALAAWESESWLLLFPDTFPQVRPRWKVPAKLLDKDTGRIRDAKEELKRGLGLPLFRESDGPAVAREALTRRLIPSPRGSNRSYDDFVGDLTGWS